MNVTWSFPLVSDMHNQLVEDQKNANGSITLQLVDILESEYIISPCIIIGNIQWSFCCYCALLISYDQHPDNNAFINQTITTWILWPCDDVVTQLYAFFSPESNKSADLLFQDVLRRKDRADATRNALGVLHRFKFLFNLPCSIERNIKKVWSHFGLLVSNKPRYEVC